MDLQSSIGDALEARISGGLGAGLAADMPPSTTLPSSPRRIHDRRGARRLRRVGLAALTGLGGGLIAAWALAGDALPPPLRLPQPADALPATDLFIPMLLAALGLAALWRLSAWVLPLVMAGLLLGCGLPLLTDARIGALDLLASAPLLSTLALPLLSVLLNRTLLRRVGLTGRLAGRREILCFGLIAGLGAPLLAGLLAFGALLAVGSTADGALSGALALAGAWALGLLSAGTALQASSQRPLRSGRWTGWLIAASAVAVQIGLTRLPDPGALLLVPHLLLCLHALRSAPRNNARLGAGLLALWALSTPATLAAYAGRAASGHHRARPASAARPRQLAQRRRRPGPGAGGMAPARWPSLRLGALVGIDNAPGPRRHHRQHAAGLVARGASARPRPPAPGHARDARHAGQ
jgi:hypothetical protein